MLDLVATFGSVPVNTKATEELSIQNNTDADVQFRLINISNKLAVDKCFFIDFPTDDVIHPGNFLKFNVYFFPTIPNEEYIDYYAIDVGSFDRVAVTVQGTSIGPDITLNEKEIFFHPDDKCVETFRRNIQLVNKSSVSAKFQWFTNIQGQGPFSVLPRCGVIEPYSSFSLAVDFNKNFNGYFTEEIICLISHHKPLILKAHGRLCNLSSVSSSEDEEETIVFSSINSFDVLMGESLIIRDRVPIASASCTFLDFGLGSSSDLTWNVTHILSISNHFDTAGYITWHNDIDIAFKIEPEHIYILGQGVEEFTVKFRPRFSEMAYSSILVGNFCIPDSDSIKYYHTFRISVMGHTFSGKNMLTPMWFLPKNVILPPTPPCHNVFTNFTIENRTQVPLLFKFIAPKESDYAVMPMCGIVEPISWAIISVALQPQFTGIFVEEWKIELNIFTEVQITFFGNAEICKYEMAIYNKLDTISKIDQAFQSANIIEMGSDCSQNVEIINEVERAAKNYYKNKKVSKGIIFGITHPGCESRSVLFIHNTTRSTIHIKFLYAVDWLRIDGDGTIVIRHNEIMPVCVTFNPSSVGIYKSSITLSCIMIIRKTVIGKPTDTVISAEGICNFAKIQVHPETKDLGKILCFSQQTANFNIVNISQSYLYFKLGANLDYMAKDFKTSKDAIAILPKKGTIKPGETCEFKIYYKPENPGLCKLTVMCYIYKNSYIKEIISQLVKKRRIFSLYSEGFHRSCQIYCIRSINCPRAFSQYALWKMMNIDMLNQTMKNIQPNTILTVHMQVPTAQINSEPLRLALILKQSTPSRCSWIIKRIKMCDCHLTKRHRSLTFIEYAYECPHRLILKLSPENGFVGENNTISELFVDVNYNLIGKHTLAFLVSFDNGRIIHLKITAIITNNICDTVWPYFDKEKKNSNESFELNCGKVFIGNATEVYRWLLIHNTSPQPLLWELLASNKLNEPFKCITKYFLAAPDQTITLLFSFRPTKQLDYKTLIIGYLNKIEVTIIVTGTGTMFCSVEPPIYIPDCILYPRKYLPDRCVYLSTYYIPIRKLLQHSTNTRIFALNNPTSKIIKFEWKKVTLPNSIECTVEPSDGLVKAFDTKWFILHVSSLNIPTSVTFQMRCDLLDYSEKRHLMESPDNKVHFTDSEITLKNEYNAKRKQPNKIPEMSSLWITITVVVTSFDDNCLSLQDKFKLSPIDSVFGDNAYISNNLIQETDLIKIMKRLILTCLKDNKLKFHYMQLNNTENMPTFAQLNVPERQNTTILNDRYISKILSNWIYQIIHKVLIIERCHCNINNCKCN